MTIYEYANFGNINEKQTAGRWYDVSQYILYTMIILGGGI